MNRFDHSYSPANSFGGEPLLGLAVEEYLPRQRIRIVWQGAAPNAFGRNLALAVVFLGGVAWLTLLISLTRRLVAAANVNEDVAISGIVLAVGFYLLYSITSLFGRGLGYWKEICWDAVEGQFTAQQRGWLLWGHRTHSAPLSAITSLSLRLGSEEILPLPAKLTQFYSPDFEELSFDIDLKALRFSRRVEAIEFLFGIGRLLAAESFQCSANTEEEQRILIWQKYQPLDDEDEDFDEDTAEEEDEEADFDDEERLTAALSGDGDQLAPPTLGIRPLPAAGELPADLQHPIPPVLLQPSDGHPFDQDAFRDKVGGYQIQTWNPDALVHIHKSAEPAGLVVIGGVMGLIPGALVGWFPLWGVANSFLPLTSTDRYLLTGVAAFFCALLAAFILWNSTRSQETIIDWRRRICSWRNGKVTEEWPLDNLRRIALVQYRQQAPPSNDTSSPKITYFHQVECVLPERRITIAKADISAAVPAESRALLQPLATEVARSLGVDCVLESKQAAGPSLGTMLSLTAGQWAALSFVLLGVAMWLGVLGVQEARLQWSAAEIRAHGVKFYRMGSFRRENRVIGENYWVLAATAKEYESIREHAQELRPLLARFSDLGFDFRESNVIDEDLKLFAGLAGVRIVHLESTAITDEGIESLAQCPNLFYLDLYDCHVGDQAAAALGKLRQLHYLYLPGTHITDAGLPPLSAISTLETLQLGGTRTTPQGIQALRQSLPHTAISP